MQISSRLTLSRHNIYYFRFPIPTSLHPESKQSCIRVSLDTHNPQEALHISKALSYVGNELIQQPMVRGMEYQQLRNVLHEYFRTVVERRKQRMAREGRLSDVEKSALNNTHGFIVDALKYDDYEFVGGDAEIMGFIRKNTLSIQPDTKEYVTLRTEYLKAFRGYCNAILKHDGDMEDYDFSDKESASNPSHKLKVKKLSTSIDTYVEEKLSLKQWRQNSAMDYRGQFNLLLEYLGNDTSLHISSDLAGDVKNILLRLPKNMSKKVAYKGKTIPELMAMDIPKDERLYIVTVAKYIRTYSTFYDWAVKRKDTNENNFAALVDNVKKAHKPREKFKPEDSNRIVANVLDAKKAYQKWATLIAFYTAARLNEIAQLDTTDIVQKDNVWCFNITDEGDDNLKRLKNQSSKRFVPIHSRLIELGFLDFVKDAGKGRLFNELTYKPKDGYGRNLSHWFIQSLLRTQLGIRSSGLTFHSIRHTVAQQLRDNNVAESTIKEIMGHSQSGVTFGTYANALDKRVMQQAIETLHYA